MYCLSCPKRGDCEQICENLERHLASFEGYQREIPFDPTVLEPLQEKTGCSFQDMFPDLPWLWNAICRHFAKVPHRFLVTFLLHYYEGLSVVEVAKSLGVHRTTVNRRLRTTEGILKREVEKSRKRKRSG